jgi:hypothetical protein
MPMQKAFAVGVIVVILGGQLAAIVPPEGAVRRSHRFWPFMNYPMYATPRHAGDVHRVPSVWVTRCNGAEEPAPPSALGLSDYRYREMLQHVADAPADTTDRALISHLVTARIAADACRISIHERGYVMTRDGWNPATDIPDHEVVSWELTQR